MTPTTRKHLAAIQSGAVTKTNISGISKAMRTYHRIARGYSVGCTSPKVTWDDITALMTNLDYHRPRVTGELHASGVKLLTSKRYAKRLASVADIIADIDHFILCDFADNSDYRPIYRAVASNGNSFQFLYEPWQSGGDGVQLHGRPQRN